MNLNQVWWFSYLIRPIKDEIFQKSRKEINKFLTKYHLSYLYVFCGNIILSGCFLYPIKIYLTNIQNNVNVITSIFSVQLGKKSSLENEGSLFVFKVT